MREKILARYMIINPDGSESSAVALTVNALKRDSDSGKPLLRLNCSN